MHFGFYSVALFFLGAPILTAWGTPRQRYTLPASSFSIVTCPMICSMVTMFVLYALAAAMLNLLYDAGWPIWGPGLVAAFLVGWTQAILWSTSNSQGLQLVSCLVSFGVLLFGVMTCAMPGESASGWFHEALDTSNVLAFGLAALFCLGVGTVGFANLRCGRRIDVSRIAEWPSRLFPKAARATPFPSPTAAQFWLEWTERGYVMPVGTAVIGVVVLLITPFVSPPDSIEFINGISAILLLPTLVVGLFLGARSPNGQFSNFNGSRPLTDNQIGNAVLASVTVGVLSSALIWAVVMGAVSLFLRLADTPPSLPSTSELFVISVRLVGIATLVVGVAWSVVALMTSLILAGKKVSSVVIGTLFGVLIVGKMVPHLPLSPEAQDTFLFVFGRACIFLPPVGITATFVVGWWLQLVSRGTLAFAAGIVALMLAGTHLAFGFTNAPNSYLPALWGCCLAPSALVVAPLAVRWNRHRC